jgi:hypothetical protein
MGGYQYSILLPRGTTRGIEHPITDLLDVALTPIVAAAILGEDHSVNHGAQRLARDPQQAPGPRQAFLDGEVVAVPRDTPVPITRQRSVWEYQPDRWRVTREGGRP